MPNNQDLQKRIAQLERQVAALMKWKDEKEKHQLKYPLDKATMYALDNAFRNFTFTGISVKDVFFYPQLTNPTAEGQMRFYNDLTTQNFRCTTTAGVFTGSIDLTAV